MSSNTQQKHYATLNVVRKRSGLGDNKQQDDLLEIEMNEIDKFINESLANFLGPYNSSGNPIVLPLTSTTSPPLPAELSAKANDLTVWKFRADQTNTPQDIENWENRQKYFLDVDLPRIFGWSRGKPFSTPAQITMDVRTGPVGTVVTIGGTNFRQYALLYFLIEGTPITTTPISIVTDVNGSFSGAQVTIPSYLGVGPHFITVRDGTGTMFDADHSPLAINGAQLAFQVTP